MRILLVEDDVKLCKILQKFLEKETHVCDQAQSVRRAEEKLKKSEEFDLIIMDVVLPDGNGIDFCRSLRKRGVETPIVMLTSKRATIDRVTGLDAGADDYMPKPFHPDELMARIRAILRRPKHTIGDTLECGPLSINLLEREVFVKGQQLDVMPKEYALLEYLVRRKGEAIPRHELLRHVWGVYSQTGSNRLEVYIRYLRRKIAKTGGSKMIITVRGVGYKIVED